MKAIVQKVLHASVTVKGEVVGAIGPGLCVLLGISKDDNHKDTEFMVRKLLNLRVFSDGEKLWSKSVKDLGLEILCVSQFTLQCVLKGNKPDFHCAMNAARSEPFYQDFMEKLRKSYNTDKIKEGVFGAYMEVSIVNDGPVTIEVNSPPPRLKKKTPEDDTADLAKDLSIQEKADDSSLN